MSILSTSIKYLRQAAVLLLLPWLAWSCQLVTDDYDDEIDINGTPKYINVTISVSADNNALTRSPQGGEYGDGVEKGNDRENQVNNITLIFYKDESDPTCTNTNINTTSDNVKVVCVKQYAVRPFESTDLPNSHTHKTGELSTVQENEVLYTTGNQKLEGSELQAGQNYKVLVVANASVNVAVGNKIKDVRDKLASSIYTGSGIGINATNFVMTSESDDTTVSLNNPTIETSGGENRFIYYFSCIHIERLAARIDYCTKGGTYSDTYGGYKYNMGTTDADGFYVVTKVTPFNLYNEDEYLFKRVQDAWPANATTYLGNESTTNYVVDPNTANKDNTNVHTFNYLSPLVREMTNSYTQDMSSLSEGQTFIDGSGYNNVIIAYPRENTLTPTSHLKKYATGLVFEVNLYPKVNVGPNGVPGPQNHRKLVYYHYLRHQGEMETGVYQAKELKPHIFDHDEETCGTMPMKCGIVRNNIYRVSIESLNPTNGTIKLKIEEEKWRHVDNPTIYI